MRSRILLCCRLVVALLALAATAAPARAADGDLEVVEVRSDGFPRVVVRLNVTAIEDLSAAALTPSQIRVVEDGQPQPAVDLIQIRNPALPASVVLAIDVSGSMADQDRLPQAREAAKVFLGQMRTFDRVALLSFAADVTLRQPFTADRGLLSRAIDGLAPAGNTSLYDALIRAVGQVAAAPSGIRAVVLLTDGEDTQSASGVAEGIGLAARAGIPIYPIGLGDEVRADVLERIANETGGRYYHAPGPQDLARVFRLISRQLTSQYELFWVSRLKGEAGREVPVQVSLNRPAAPVTRFSYRLPRFARVQPVPGVSGRELATLGAAAPPGDEQILLAGSLAGLAAAFLYAGLVQPRIGRRLEARMARYLAGQGTVGPRSSAGAGLSRSARRVPVSPLVAIFARVANRLLPNRLVARLRRMLIQAGLPTERHLWLFLAGALASTLLLSSLGYALVYLRGVPLRSPLLGPLVIGALAAGGLYLPYFWLRRRLVKRRRALLRALPDALDLMAIGVSAGLSLDGAILEVVQKWEGELSRELNQVLTEQRLGASRRQALLDLAERTQLEDFRLLVASLIQSEELGTNVGQVLKVQAEQLRIRRRQHAEEQARKAPIKMLIPMVLLLFPSLFVVLLGPAILSIIRMFRTLGTGS